MHFFAIFLAVILSLLSTIKAVALSPREPGSIRLMLLNNCPFDIWVRQAVAAGTSARPGYVCQDGAKETPEEKVIPRQWFVTPIPAYKDTCGHSIKIGRSPGTFDIYQYEFNWALENGKIWYNLSDVNGNPFTDVARQIGGPIGSTCPYHRCNAGEYGHQCDYPVQADCETIGDLIGYLC